MCLKVPKSSPEFSNVDVLDFDIAFVVDRAHVVIGVVVQLTNPGHSAVHGVSVGASAIKSKTVTFQILSTVLVLAVIMVAQGGNSQILGKPWNVFSIIF